MIKNYFKIAFRNLLRHKSFSFINIFGLAISMSVCLLIMMIVADQKGYDTFNKNYDRVYRINTVGINGNDMETATTAFPLGEELKKEYTGIEAAETIRRGIGGDMFYGDKIASGGGYFADGGIFEVMDFKLEAGDIKTALVNPFSIVISKQVASQLFYNENPLGKVIRFNDKGIHPGGFETGNRETAYGNFIITGVLKNNPGKTHLPFEILASRSTLKSLSNDSILNVNEADWANVWEAYTYILLPKDKTKADLQQMLDKVCAKYYTSNPSLNDKAYKAVGLSEITPGPAIGNMTSTTMPEGVLLFLGILSMIIMLSACLNYTNLSLAKSLTRAKEIGIRKVSGASRKQIFAQFIAESVVYAFIALLVACIILLLLEPLVTGLWVNQFFHISFEYNFQILTKFLLLSLVVGFIAGILPATYISVFNPIQIFKKANSIKIFKGFTIRKILLTIQFCVSLIFIVSAAMVYQQTQHIFNLDYGFNKENVVNVKLYKTENYARFAEKISSNKNVISVSACAFPPSIGTQNGTMTYRAEQVKDSLPASYIDIDAKCLDVWGLQLVAGRNLPELPTDSNETFLLINEKMVSAYQYPSAAAAIGQRLQVDGHTLEIIGVVKDFNFLSADRGVQPLMLRNRKKEFGYVTIRIAAASPTETVNFLQAAWKLVNPASKFEYEFYDQQILFFHSMLSVASKVIGFIAMLAVIISCLGLLGMATYTAETRQKEIGIRKVLGSSGLQIIFLLSKSFLGLMLLAIMIATPIAFFLNNMWLQFFANRINISAGVLIMAVMALFSISILIVFSQAWRVSKYSPIITLRSE